jgi:ACS family hexuronate transporter-like MFS transporter
MMLVSTISYIDRNTLALLAPTILRDTHLSNEQYGFIISAFSIAYMLGNPIWGRIIDRIGLRAGMGTAVSIWTLASVAHVFASGFRSFGLARAVLGFGEGATFPGGLRTVIQTLPVEQRSRGVAVTYSGGSLGALITPIVITPVAAIWGWQGAFWFTGAVGALWLAWWSLLARRPDLAQHALVEQSDVPLRWKDTRLWAFVSAYALGAFPTAFVLYQASIYLSAVMHKSQIEIGRVLWIPPLGWELGYFFWGWVTDRFAHAGASISSMRRQFFLLMWLSLPLAFIPRIESFPVTLAMLFFSMFITSGFIVGAVAYATSHYSARHSGLIAGLGAGSWSAVVALVMPAVGKLFDLRNYDAAFELAAVFPIAGYAVWRVLNRTSSLPSSNVIPKITLGIVRK